MTPQECLKICDELAFAFSGANSPDPLYRQKLQATLSMTLNQLLQGNDQAYMSVIIKLQTSTHPACNQTISHLQALQQHLNEPGIREAVTDFQQHFLENAGCNEAARMHFTSLVTCRQPQGRSK